MRVSARAVIELNGSGRHVFGGGHEDSEVMALDQLRLAEIEAEAWLRTGGDLVAAGKRTEAVSRGNLPSAISRMRERRVSIYG